MNQVSFYTRRQRRVRGTADAGLNPFMNQVSFYMNAAGPKYIKSTVS